MVEAIVLIQAMVGQSSAVASAVEQLDGVTSADVTVTGPYNVIARSGGGEHGRLRRMIVSRIQSVKGVTRTLTCPIIRL